MNRLGQLENELKEGTDEAGMEGRTRDWWMDGGVACLHACVLALYFCLFSYTTSLTSTSLPASTRRAPFSSSYPTLLLPSPACHACYVYSLLCSPAYPYLPSPPSAIVCALYCVSLTIAFMYLLMPFLLSYHLTFLPPPLPALCGKTLPFYCFISMHMSLCCWCCAFL